MPKLLFHMYWPFLMWVIFQKEKLVSLFDLFTYYAIFLDNIHIYEVGINNGVGFCVNLQPINSFEFRSMLTTIWIFNNSDLIDHYEGIIHFQFFLLDIVLHIVHLFYFNLKPKSFYRAFEIQVTVYIMMPNYCSSL
jgi:hypothetical protein